MSTRSQAKKRLLATPSAFVEGNEDIRHGPDLLQCIQLLQCAFLADLLVPILREGAEASETCNVFLWSKFFALRDLLYDFDEVIQFSATTVTTDLDTTTIGAEAGDPVYCECQGENISEVHDWCAVANYVFRERRLQ